MKPTAILCLFLGIMTTQACTPAAEQQQQTHFSNGKLLYQNYCANCHGKGGEGLAQLIPPLRQSDYLKNNFAQLPSIINNGLQGEIMVNGVAYNQPMQPITTLTPTDINYLMTYAAKAFLGIDTLIAP
jgi:mono/diheme cytochrome c family protein